MASDLDIKSITGLSEAEAARRLKEEGYNELPSARRQRSILAIALGVAHEPMFLLLIAGGAIYLILGDLQEALLLLSFVLVIIGITTYQERKTERTLEALRDLSSPRALVIRDGNQRRIVGREVVRGDILVLAEGDRVPADALILACNNLSVDESLLTGESVPVRKMVCEGTTPLQRPGGDDLPFVFSGTLVVSGQGIAEVQATGVNTEIGKIGKSLQTVESEETLLQKETRRLVVDLAIIGITVSAIVVIVYGLTRDDWKHAFLAGITLGMAVLPEEFPVVLTVFIALGAWRISKVRVLTRHAPTIETMGSTTVLCVDKTGTLTLNRMSVVRISASGQVYDLRKQAPDQLPEAFHEIVEFSILASEKDPSDPMEKAFKELGEQYLNHTEHLHRDWTLVGEYELSRKLLALSHVWKSPSGKDYVIAGKGAPEAIADLCHFSTEQLRLLSEDVSAMADDGLRVLGVAKGHFKQTTLPQEQHDFKFEFVGLVGLSDPVRPDVPDAVKECYEAGIRVVMITGDYPRTAQSIARQIGLTPVDQVITGADLDRMDDTELEKSVAITNIFARVMPEHKLRLVNALKADGEIVAMTGDGVNDAPALKSAHIGVAMGGRGTDVAREASSLVLLDDDFSSIVQAVKLGRRIFDNLRKAMSYILAIHTPIIGMSLIPVLLRWPLALLPVHIVFLELIIDPACSLVFEAETEEAGVMKRPPRDPSEPLFNRRTLVISLLQGLSVLLIVFAVFAIARYRGLEEGEIRALTFTTLVIANLGLIVSNRSWSRTLIANLRSPNTALRWVLGGALFFLAMVLYVPALRDLFHFATLHWIELLICLVAGAISILWFELFKVFSRGIRPATVLSRFQ
jgi:Ca2+-transporting ATPase